MSAESSTDDDSPVCKAWLIDVDVVTTVASIILSSLTPVVLYGTPCVLLGDFRAVTSLSSDSTRMVNMDTISGHQET